MKLTFMPSCDIWFVRPGQGETYGFVKGAPPKQTELLKRRLSWSSYPSAWWYIVIDGYRYATWTWPDQDSPRLEFYAIRVTTYKVTNVKLKSKRQV